MRLAAMSRTRVDGDILEEFARNTLRFVDELVVVDNGSLDDTPEILRALKGEGLPISVIAEERVTHSAEYFGNLAKRVLGETSCDFLFSIDVDEFIGAHDVEHLRAELARLPVFNHGLVYWKNYIPMPGDEVGEPRLLARTTHRLAYEERQFGKIAISRAFLDQPSADYADGHSILSKTGEKPVPLSGVWLAHFPVRSIQQIQAKALLGWSTILASGYDPSTTAYQWRKTFDQLTEARTWTESDLSNWARNYLRYPSDPITVSEVVHDPVPPVERRYSTRPHDVLALAVDALERLARHYAAVSRNLAEAGIVDVESRAG